MLDSTTRIWYERKTYFHHQLSLIGRVCGTPQGSHQRLKEKKMGKNKAVLGTYLKAEYFGAIWIIHGLSDVFCGSILMGDIQQWVGRTENFNAKPLRDASKGTKVGSNTFFQGLHSYIYLHFQLKVNLGPKHCFPLLEVL